MALAKTTLVFLLVTSGAAACSADEADQKVRKDAIMKAVTIPVDGMACDSCAARIEKELVRIDGVLDADVNFDNKSAVIKYDARKLEPQRLVAAIGGMGFKAGPVPEATP
ncbi:MAG: heavy-metal-associated domain-containing protein [Deltaproteobacteria bacterium]|nr:heavy-metal-associated domain-containing protein [Deltaproteobacteria bacterium]